MTDPHVGDLDALDEGRSSVPPTPQGAHSEQPGADPQPARASPRDASIIPFFFASLFGALFGMWGYWFIFDRAPGDEQGGLPEVVVVDSDTLLQAKIQETILAGGPSDDATAQAFREAMQEAFMVYTSRGISVLHSSALMAYPQEFDVTERVADVLGLAPESLASVREFQRTGQLPQEVIDKVSSGIGQGSPAAGVVPPAPEQADETPAQGPVGPVDLPE